MCPIYTKENVPVLVLFPSKQVKRVEHTES